MFGLIGFLLMTIASVAWGAAAVGGDEESGQLELTLAHGVTRTQVVLERALAILLRVVLLVALVFALILLLNDSAQLNIRPENLLGASVLFAGLTMLSGSTALFVGAVTGRKTYGVAAGAGVGVLGYVFNAVGRQSKEVDWLLNLSPYSWAYENNPVANGADWAAAGWLWGFRPPSWHSAPWPSAGGTSGPPAGLRCWPSQAQTCGAGRRAPGRALVSAIRGSIRAVRGPPEAPRTPDDLLLADRLALADQAGGDECAGVDFPVHHHALLEIDGLLVEADDLRFDRVPLPQLQRTSKGDGFPAATGLHPLRRMALQVPLRAIRSNRPRSIREKYMPLLTCIAMSMSVGRTFSGSDDVSQMRSGERREDVKSRRSVRRSRCMGIMLPASNNPAKDGDCGFVSGSVDQPTVAGPATRPRGRD